MQKSHVVRLILPLVLICPAIPALAIPTTGFDWSTGQGLLDTCSGINIPQDKATEDDVALMLMCIVQFKTWRDSLTYMDAYKILQSDLSGPICIPQMVTHKAVIEKFLAWSNANMTRELREQPSTLSVFKFMLTTYPCPTAPEKQRSYERES
ncbi:hypothetical protein N5D48_05025 [Pseudomonas sp. GD03858]|uniref:hypothetical protein n=1 Tax=unclassified Pseudomonas TaxID=196821 RepID=UPI002449BD38|nr:MULTISPECIES: hypothetical protein [unclassified Pseudomonas]MDH0646245.1 hypothetical protein [Pseudomonas sp. GD03867]MDH0661756.1 hypothetical protein [Pseudomonas sp. GD03858]